MGKDVSAKINLFCFFVISLIGFSADALSGPEKNGPAGPKLNQTVVRVLLIPFMESTISGEISARINKINGDMGDHFVKGRPLILFDCEIYQARLKKAEAEYKAAKKTLEANRRLEELKSISDLEVAVAEANLEKAKAEVMLNAAQVKKCTIYAPFNGRILKREADPFEYVLPGQSLLEVIDNSRIYLQLFVPSVWLQWMKPSLSFFVRIDETGKTYAAEVTSLGAKVDPVSQTLEIRGKIEGHHPELLAGMSGNAYFTLPKPTGLKR